jgi:hypothetical protein
MHWGAGTNVVVSSPLYRFCQEPNAKDRKDNTEPAATTEVSVLVGESIDHKVNWR